jgi:hypothetical protein
LPAGNLVDLARQLYIAKGHGANSMRLQLYSDLGITDTQVWVMPSRFGDVTEREIS